MGETYSVLNKALISITDNYVLVRGATGRSEKAYVFKLPKRKLGKQMGVAVEAGGE